MDYKELVKSMRYCAEFDCTPDCPRAGIGKGCIRGLKQEAADAIESLQGQIDGWVTQERKALLKSIPKWIPVTERLPEDDTHVLGWDGKRVRFVYVVTDLVFDAFAEKEGITHWMPLPEPPKEETE